MDPDRDHAGVRAQRGAPEHAQARADARARAYTPINYALMNQRFPKQKAALTRAIKRIEAARPANNWDTPGPEHRKAVEALAALGPATAHAAVKVWDGGAGTTDWTDGANWSPDGVPTSADDVTIDVPGSLTVTISSGSQSAMYSVVA